MPLKEKGKQKPTRKLIPSLSRDPLAKGVAAGRGMKKPRRRSNPGASMLSSY